MSQKNWPPEMSAMVRRAWETDQAYQDEIEREWEGIILGLRQDLQAAKNPAAKAAIGQWLEKICAHRDGLARKIYDLFRNRQGAMNREEAYRSTIADLEAQVARLEAEAAEPEELVIVAESSLEDQCDPLRGCLRRPYLRRHWDHLVGGIFEKAPQLRRLLSSPLSASQNERWLERFEGIGVELVWTELAFFSLFRRADWGSRKKANEVIAAVAEAVIEAGAAVGGGEEMGRLGNRPVLDNVFQMEAARFAIIIPKPNLLQELAKRVGRRVKGISVPESPIPVIVNSAGVTLAEAGKAFVLAFSAQERRQMKAEQTSFELMRLAFDIVERRLKKVALRDRLMLVFRCFMEEKMAEMHREELRDLFEEAKRKPQDQELAARIKKTEDNWRRLPRLGTLRAHWPEISEGLLGMYYSQENWERDFAEQTGDNDWAESCRWRLFQERLVALGRTPSIGESERIQLEVEEELERRILRRMGPRALEELYATYNDPQQGPRMAGVKMIQYVRTVMGTPTDFRGRERIIAEVADHPIRQP